MLETLFKSIRGIDEKVFTPELKDKLDEMFNEAVDTKAKLIAEEMVEAEKAKLQEQAKKNKKYCLQKQQSGFPTGSPIVAFVVKTACALGWCTSNK